MKAVPTMILVVRPGAVQEFQFLNPLSFQKLSPTNFSTDQIDSIRNPSWFTPGRVFNPDGTSSEMGLQLFDPKANIPPLEYSRL